MGYYESTDFGDEIFSVFFIGINENTGWFLMWLGDDL